MQKCNIIVNLFVLNFGGCDVVLGVDWLRNLGIIWWNFAELSMDFSMGGEEFLLQGLKRHVKDIEEEHNLSKIKLIEERGIWLQLRKIERETEENSSEPAIQTVLQEFYTVFKEPQGLPPPRSYDY